ncbi:hypothetical protein L9F63_021247 [Diploptera punctata]|uniref:L-serine ammonia-lyase n=1 Tax=Diploptera punctata TaxID=6984 RepID=A0AAD7ZP96_DIPPU|nr:hypothetical protein L9F63_021247 [Diploptera punctata]
MNSLAEKDIQIHSVTPLLHSLALSKLMSTGTEVFIKCENAQPTGSFKVRGIGRLANKLKKDGYERLIGASGGNAGLAISYASQVIGMPCTVFVPVTAPKNSVQRIKEYGAEVKIIGNCYAEAEKYALKEAEKQGNAFLSPYDDPEVWKGHSTIIDEIKASLPRKPSALVVADGGGGLLLGVLQGLQSVGWQDVPVLAMETCGADCFNLAVEAKRVVVLEKITSIAKCLGASSVPPYLLEVLPDFNVTSRVISDETALESCIRFADDERIVVEPACGAALAAVYGGVLSRLQIEGIIPTFTTGPVVVIVCGGAGVSLQMLQNWATELNIKFP